MYKKLKMMFAAIAATWLGVFCGYFSFKASSSSCEFFNSALSAFCGTFAAALMVWFIEHQKLKTKFRKDSNVALARIHSTMYSLLNFKRTQLLPLTQESSRIQKIYSGFLEEIVKNKKGDEAISPTEFPKISTRKLLTRLTVSGIAFNLSTPELITDHAFSHKMIIIAEQANLALTELSELCEEWKRTVSDYSQNTMLENVKLAMFYGVYPSSMSEETSIKSLIDEIYFKVEAALAFLDLLADKVKENAVETLGSERRILKIELTDSFRALMPSRESLKHWEEF